ncbi:MAG: hypothetical protein M1814_000911 [Vezdaea aestivalis]|nr:MAG: hypothetical protein M1814_000911 [Vezdaea aestivalis]
MASKSSETCGASSSRSAKQKKQDTERFRRRRNCVVRKALQLEKLCGADVYVVFRYHEKFSLYVSPGQRNSWPPTQTQINNSYPPPKYMTPQGSEDRALTPDKPAPDSTT